MSRPRYKLIAHLRDQIDAGTYETKGKQEATAAKLAALLRLQADNAEAIRKGLEDRKQ